MPTKMRLQRRGKKGQPFYHIVIADGRAPRDGKFVEKIGTYNPLTKPADIEMDFDRALYWLQNGAQATDTVRAILSYKGILYKNHLLNGVKKGAMSQEQADAKFDAWLNEKQAKIEGKLKEVEQESKSEAKKRLEAERKVNEQREKELSDKRAAALKAEEAKRVKDTGEEAADTVESATEETATEATAETEEIAKEDVKEEEVVATEEKEAEAETEVEAKEELEAVAEEKPAEAENTEEEKSEGESEEEKKAE